MPELMPYLAAGVPLSVAFGLAIGAVMGYLAADPPTSGYSGRKMTARAVRVGAAFAAAAALVAALFVLILYRAAWIDYRRRFPS